MIASKAPAFVWCWGKILKIKSCKILQDKARQVLVVFKQYAADENNQKPIKRSSETKQAVGSRQLLVGFKQYELQLELDTIKTQSQVGHNQSNQNTITSWTQSKQSKQIKTIKSQSQVGHNQNNQNNQVSITSWTQSKQSKHNFKLF